MATTSTQPRFREKRVKLQVAKGERGLRAHFSQANEARLAQSTDGFAPTEYLLDQFAFLEAHRVAGVR